MKLSNHINHPNGFSLVEIMITIALIGILAGTAGIGVMGQMPKIRLNGATKNLAWDLIASRQQAIRKKHQIKVTFTNNHIYNIWVDKDNNGSVDSGEETSKDIHDDYPGVSVAATQNPIFDETGKVINPPTITLTNSSGTKQITISIVGVIKLG